MKPTMKPHPVVILESPYRGNIALNMAYLEVCLRDSILKHGEAPIATHKLYTMTLDDSNAAERYVGMQAVLGMYPVATKVVVYYDLGISSGMEWGMVQAQKAGKIIEPRSLYNHPIPREWDVIIEQVEKEAAL